MAIGIREIAAAAGVSISTVSNVLNGRANVGEETRQLVRRLCVEMDYIPNAAGKGLKSGKNRTILFNFSDFDRSFYLKIIEGIHDYAGENDYDLMICTTKSCEKYMRSSLTSGCIILDERMKNDVLARAAGIQYPIVVLDRILPHSCIKSVVVNNYDPMTQLVREITARGYRKFVFVGGPSHTGDTQERFAAFQDVLKDQGIPFSREYYFSGDYREKSGYQAARIFLSTGDLPEIFICANDNMAIGVIKALREEQCRIPEDVAVTGFDNCELAENIGLTTVHIPNYERGYLAARSLIENIEGGANFDPVIINAAVSWGSTLGKKNP
ncbi:MAG: LacI family transcriptional regulator [Spirochaetaceae bacterium]|jgi:LacI family transcriptional regulator|nr:LacI family transcriptional regulator [Spirochaetaceae bacterium]